jgi:opacity protein-like surface antigen
MQLTNLSSGSSCGNNNSASSSLSPSGMLSFQHDIGDWSTAIDFSARFVPGVNEGFQFTPVIQIPRVANFWVFGLHFCPGYKVTPSTTLYAVAGVDATRFRIGTRFNDSVFTLYKNALGATFGLGASMQVSDRWSVKLDYLYTRFQSISYKDVGQNNGIRIKPRMHAVAFGLSYQLL